MDIKHVLSCNPLEPAFIETTPAVAGASEPARWIEHGAGLFEAGHSDYCFAFDNESPRHKVYLEAFRISDRLVTSG